MALLKREEWQGFVRDVDWTYTYVDDDAVFPEWHSGTGKVPREAWSAWEEDYKVSYPEYVAVQRDKEASAYAVKAALQRSSTFEHLDEGWKSATKMHFGGVALVEYAAVLAELKMARFGLNGAWRNMATFGQLDELRHAQITTFFGHEFVGKDAQYDWTQKAFHTNDWVLISLRNLFDNMMIAPNVVDMAIELPFTFETGFTNLQFVALASDALESGDVNFANMISSIQTDEARHSQQGGPTLEILVEHDPVRAQWVVDKAFWGSARAFAALTGTGDGLLHPAGAPQAVLPGVHGGVGHRPVRPHDRGLRAPQAVVLGRVHARPGHLAPRAADGAVVLAAHAVVAAQGRGQPGRAGLAGREVPELGEGLRRQVGRPDRQRQRQQRGSHAAGDAALAVHDLPPALLQRHPVRDGTWRVRDWPLRYDGKTFHFCTNGCRQIFWKDRDNVNHETLVDRFLAGQIQPMDVGGILGYMGMTPDAMGDDPDYEAWTRD